MIFQVFVISSLLLLIVIAIVQGTTTSFVSPAHIVPAVFETKLRDDAIKGEFKVKFGCFVNSGYTPDACQDLVSWFRSNVSHFVLPGESDDYVINRTVAVVSRLLQLTVRLGLERVRTIGLRSGKAYELLTGMYESLQRAHMQLAQPMTTSLLREATGNPDMAQRVNELSITAGLLAKSYLQASWLFVQYSSGIDDTNPFNEDESQELVASIDLSEKIIQMAKWMRLANAQISQRPSAIVHGRQSIQMMSRCADQKRRHVVKLAFSTPHEYFMHLKITMFGSDLTKSISECRDFDDLVLVLSLIQPCGITSEDRFALLHPNPLAVAMTFYAYGRFDVFENISGMSQSDSANLKMILERMKNRIRFESRHSMVASQVHTVINAAFPILPPFDIDMLMRLNMDAMMPLRITFNLNYLQSELDWLTFSMCLVYYQGTFECEY